MIINNGTPSQEAYLDKCIKSAISQISNLDFSNLSSLNLTANLWYADTLSELSIITKITYFAIDNYATVNRDLITSMIESEKLIFARTAFNDNSISSIQSIIKNFISTLTLFQTKILDMFSLEQGSIDMFSTLDVEAGINYLNLEQSSPLIFNYYEGRTTLTETTALIKKYTNLRDSFSLNKSTLLYSSVNKASDILSYFSGLISDSTNQLDDISYLIDSSSLALYVYSHYLLSNTTYYNSFLNRNYATIKSDIISSYFN